MNPLRRHALRALAAVSSLPLTGPVWAAWPDKPLKLVIPFSPGGNADLVGRVWSARMAETLGQSIVVDNRPGAGGGLGAEQVAKSEPDGYTLLLGTNGPLTVNPVLQSRTRYDPFKDFVPIALAGSVPHVLIVSNGLPAKTLPELLALARKRPVTVATSGVGSSTHLSLERLNARAGVKLEHVPYRGGSTPVADLISGTLDAVMMEASTALPLHLGGKARVLNVASVNRLNRLPDVRTFQEDGLKDFLASSYVGMLAPAGTAPATISRLQRAAAEALTHASVQDKLTPLGFETAAPAAQTSSGFAALLRTEYDRASEIAKAANITLE